MFPGQHTEPSHQCHGLCSSPCKVCHSLPSPPTAGHYRVLVFLFRLLLLVVTSHVAVNILQFMSLSTTCSYTKFLERKLQDRKKGYFLTLKDIIKGLSQTAVNHFTFRPALKKRVLISTFPTIVTCVGLLVPPTVRNCLAGRKRHSSISVHHVLGVSSPSQ